MDQIQLSQSDVNLTEAAIRRVQRLMEERDVSGHALRVFVSGGGCSGLQYGMALESEPRENDLQFSFNDVNVVIDPMSMGYLAGSTIDYTDDIMGGGFQIDNPNALASCGCGNSFRTEKGQARAKNSAGCDHN
ncbi:MAG: iron-sulfur cluster insertion protein ErpA [Anaerolineales bacterium]|nr:iron-sulfur cluster insertion protein ErpA [Anaerolineales bacterium]